MVQYYYESTERTGGSDPL